MNYFRYGLWALALSLGLWWGIGSLDFKKKSDQGGDSEFRMIPKKNLRALSQMKSATNSSGAAGKKIPAPLDGSMDTGAGQEIAGEKILRFQSDAAYRKFLTGAPAGVVLDRIDGLRAVRVEDGEWLKSMSPSSQMELGKNYYVSLPEVPGEVKTMGDAFYRVVGGNILKLIGAEGVTEDSGKGVTVALLDTGLNSTRTDLGIEEGHGTAMASLISGVGSAKGAAPGATVRGYQVLDGTGTGDSFTLAKAIYEAVDGGAKVVNMSLGSSGDCTVVREAVAYALSKNIAVVAAAGNEAINRVAYPAAYDGVVAVGSVDGDPINSQHLYFSNRGKAVDVVAPGFAVMADWPGGKMVEVSGTSASTAIVSGAIAALMSKERGLTGRQAAELIVQYANDTGARGVDDETGKGVVNLQRVFERNQRGIIDLATAGIVMDSVNGKVTVAFQNRGTETVNSPTFEITVGEQTRKFYPGSIAPGESLAESVQFDPIRAKQEGGIGVGANVEAPRGGDTRNQNDIWSGWFKISK